MSEKATLSELLVRSLDSPLPRGWIYLSADPPWSADTRCLLLEGEELDCDEEELQLKTSGAGFPCEGLDTQTFEDVVRWVLRFDRAPSVELLLESFHYYHQYDAFLPRPGAPEPPPAEVIFAELDRRFYEGLGEERADYPCQAQGCNRGAVRFSVFCRPHHFENIKGKPSPFFD